MNNSIYAKNLNSDNLTEDTHHARSDFIRRLVQITSTPTTAIRVTDGSIPMTIVQFWDNLDRLPDDVKECMDSWEKVKDQGIKRILFSKIQARDFIYQKLGKRYAQAYDLCYHPAMLSDYFRLCYIFVEGGCYIDADDVYGGFPLRHLFIDGRLKLQPLCYDVATDTMVSQSLFLRLGADSLSWIFYFNNNPLIAGKGHPVIERALSQATSYLEKGRPNGLPEIQSTTGPGNLTKSLFDVLTENPKKKSTMLVLYDWENIARTRWELSYRSDKRNWRNSNCQSYEG